MSCIIVICHRSTLHVQSIASFCAHSHVESNVDLCTVHVESNSDLCTVHVESNSDLCTVHVEWDSDLCTMHVESNSDLCIVHVESNSDPCTMHVDPPMGSLLFVVHSMSRAFVRSSPAICRQLC